MLFRCVYVRACLSLCVRVHIFTHIECMCLHASTHVPWIQITVMRMRSPGCTVEEDLQCICRPGKQNKQSAFAIAWNLSIKQIRKWHTLCMHLGENIHTSECTSSPFLVTLKWLYAHTFSLSLSFTHRKMDSDAHMITFPWRWNTHVAPLENECERVYIAFATMYGMHACMNAWKHSDSHS